MTIQGEGVDQGVVSHFVRFGGCLETIAARGAIDTPYAVLPNEVRENSTKMNADEIANDIAHRSDAPWIVLTGGNPALHDLSSLIDALHEMHYLVAVETQGSRWRDWMRDLDRLCVSPKPPSAKEPKSKQSVLQRFIDEGMRARALGERDYHWMFLKIPIFDDADLDYAVMVRGILSDAPLYLTAGNDAGRTVGRPYRQDKRRLAGVRRDLLEKYSWLVEAVFDRPELCVPDVTVQHQDHVLIWGNSPGR